MPSIIELQLFKKTQFDHNHQNSIRYNDKCDTQLLLKNITLVLHQNCAAIVRIIIVQALFIVYVQKMLVTGIV